MLARYTVEVIGQGGWTNLQAAADRARHAARSMQVEGTPVRFLRSIFMPEDGSCLFLYEGPSADVVATAARRAQLRPTRIEPTVTLDGREAEP
jgi:hypothetical protein